MATEKENQIPEHTEGKKTDVCTTEEFQTDKEAHAHFLTCRERLLNVSSWKSISSVPAADFIITDENGQEVKRPAQKGDFIKIDIPGPGSVAGDGNDWVRIEEIEHVDDAAKDEEFTAIKVRPAANPVNKDKASSDHFFHKNATSTFIVRRVANTVSAEVHGRNETSNQEEASGLVDKIRHAVIAIGAFIGFSEMQWKSLTAGIVSKK